MHYEFLLICSIGCNKNSQEFVKLLAYNLKHNTPSDRR